MLNKMQDGGNSQKMSKTERERKGEEERDRRME